MKNWKEGIQLAAFELKLSKRGFLMLPPIIAFIAFDFRFNFGTYLENNFFAVDLLFLIMFTLTPLFMKPIKFQVQQMNDDFIVAPPIIKMQQLPIPTDVIVKSRFIIYFVYALPIQLIWLTILYVMAPALQEMLTVSSFISFSVIWLAFGVYVGSLFAVTDAGDRSSSLRTTVYGVIILVAAVSFYVLFKSISDYGIVHCTIIFAQKWPILSILISVILAFIGLSYWQSYMKKTINKLDYL